MAKPHALCLLLAGVHIASALGAMYEAYTIEPAGFVVNTTEQTTQFMCSVNADRNGHTAFRIRDDTGECEMGNITANATQNPNGIMVYVKSGNTVQKCVISPTSSSGYNTHHSGSFPISATLVDNQQDSHHTTGAPYNFWVGDYQTLAHFTIDMGCIAKIIRVQLRNSHNAEDNNGGTKDWNLMIADTTTGPWTEIANGTLQDPRVSQWNVPLTVITPSGYDIPAGQLFVEVVNILCSAIHWSDSSITDLTRTKDYLSINLGLGTNRDQDLSTQLTVIALLKMIMHAREQHFKFKFSSSDIMFRIHIYS